MDAGNTTRPRGRFAAVRMLGKAKDVGFIQVATDSKHDDRKVAIKYVPRSLVASSLKYLLREVLNHHQLSLSHYPHIVQFHEVFITPKYIGLVMEYVEGKDLQSYLMKEGGSLPVDVARFLFQQLVLAVEFMHKKGKVHRDIRLSNVLVVDSGLMPIIKLRDFHLSKDTVEDSVPRGQVGAALFTSPEVVLNVGRHQYDGALVDCWSCGVVLFMMLFGHHPFLTRSDMALGESEQVVRLIENEVKGQLSFPPGADPSACDLLRRILVPAPKQRYNIAAIMRHEWFQKKLPEGALELNSSYLHLTSYQDVQQTACTIKRLIQSAAQDVEPDADAAAKAAAQEQAPPAAPVAQPSNNMLLQEQLLLSRQPGLPMAPPGSFTVASFTVLDPALLRVFALSADHLYR